MTIKDIETRSAEIREAMTSEDADLKSLIEEAKELKTRKAEIIETEKAEAKAKEVEAEIRKAEMEEVKSGEGKVIERMNTEMAEKVEVRDTKEYIDAYARYIVSEDDTECRAMLTELAQSDGQIPVPTIVYDTVKTAWEKDGIMALVRRSYAKGILKVGFEIDGDPAQIHEEGDEAIAEEELTLGVVSLVPASIKKWISISDEAIDLSEEFLMYIYDEIAYRIAKFCADSILGQIINVCTDAPTSTCPAVAEITASTVDVGTVAQAMAQLSDEASNPVVVMNKATWGEFKSAQANANYGYDPFEGLQVVFNNSMKAYSVASTGDTYAIVGDFGEGALVNFPAGDGIKFKYDDLSLATEDLVKVIGRMYVGIGVVGNNAFCKILK